MKRIALIPATLVLVMALGTGASRGMAQDAAPPPKPGREDLREQFKQLSPEERQAKLKELREKLGGATGQVREEWEKRREELKNLPPEEREAKLKEWRQQRGGPPDLRHLSPEEREAKRKELLERLEKQLAELRQKKADGTLTPEEAKRLERMEEIARRFEETGATPRSRPTEKAPAGEPDRPAGNP